MTNHYRFLAVLFLGFASLSGCTPVSNQQAASMQYKMQNIDQQQAQPMESDGPLGYNTTVHR